MAGTRKGWNKKKRYWLEKGIETERKEMINVGKINEVRDLVCGVCGLYFLCLFFYQSVVLRKGLGIGRERLMRFFQVHFF